MMDQAHTPGYPRARPTRSGEVWNERDYQALRRLAREGESLAMISRRLGRSPEAVGAAVRRLGIVLLASRSKVPAIATPDQARARLGELISGSRDSMAALSRMLRRRDGYLWSFINEAQPLTLAPDECKLLAAYFSVPATDIGGEYVAPAPPNQPRNGGWWTDR